METQERKTILPIFRIMHLFPGAVTVFALLITATVNTIGLAYGVNVWAFMGDPVQTLFSNHGLLGMMGLMLFFIGTQTDIRKMKKLVHIGIPLLLVKHGVIYGAAVAFFFLFGYEGIGGISFVLFLGCMAVQNAGIYSGVADAYADDADRAFISISFFMYLPALPLIALSGTQGAPINYISLISTVVPLALGLLLGNLDPRIPPMFAKGNSMIAMFLGFQFGSFIDFVSFGSYIWQSLLLLALYYVFAVLPGFLVEKFAFKRSGYLILSFSAVGGLCLSLPGLALQVTGMGSEALVAAQVSQLAFLLIATSLLAPLLTDLANRIEFKNHPERMRLKTPKAFEFYVEKQANKKAEANRA